MMMETLLDLRKQVSNIRNKAFELKNVSKTKYEIDQITVLVGGCGGILKALDFLDNEFVRLGA